MHRHDKGKLLSVSLRLNEQFLDKSDIAFPAQFDS